MSAPEIPQVYLLTPPAFDAELFVPALSDILDTLPVACLRLSLVADADTIARAADRLRDAAHARDVPLVVDRHVGLVERLGLDGVHLTDGARSVRATREDFGPDPIIGSFCGTSRHDGMSAGEAGADYIAFGPVADTGLGDGRIAPYDVFAWWSDMIELPVVAEGGLSPELVAELAPYVDFFGIGPEIWGQDDPLSALKTLCAPLW
ncbi:MAG: thiamine phosphate synthase [Pseudomonadota bacterium]